MAPPLSRAGPGVPAVASAGSDEPGDAWTVRYRQPYRRADAIAATGECSVQLFKLLYASGAPWRRLPWQSRTEAAWCFESTLQAPDTARVSDTGRY